MGDDQQNVDKRDVFISYSHADADWVRILAENLYQAGLQLSYDAWDISPGDVLIHELDEMLLNSRDGILVVSPAAMTSKYVREEYAVLMGRAIEGGRRLIPVLLKDAEMPRLLASRIWIDFRNVDGPDYLSRVRDLVRALRGERPGPPARTGELSLPPGSGFKAAGTASCRLAIDPERTRLSDDDVDIAGPPPRADFDFDELQWKLQRARATWGTAARCRWGESRPRRAGERLARDRRQAGGRLSAGRGGDGAGANCRRGGAAE